MDFINIFSKRFITDNSYLVFNQFLKLFFPIIIIPLSLFLIGINDFGKIASELSKVLIFCFIIDFGVNIFGPPIISSNNKDLQKAIFSELTRYKLISLAITTVLFFLYFFLVEEWSNSLLIIFFFYAAGSCFDSLWFYFGTKNFKDIFVSSFIGIVSALIIIFSVYYFEVFSTELIVALLFSLPFFCTSLFSFILIIKQKIYFQYVQPIKLNLFKENLKLFISQFLSTIYLNLGPIITLNFLGPEAAAIWFTLNRIAMSLGTFAQVPYKVFFPDIAKNISTNKAKALILLKKSLLLFLCITLFGIGIFFIFFDFFNAYFFESVLDASLAVFLFFFFWSLLQIVGPVVTAYLLVLKKSSQIIALNLYVLLILLLVFYPLTYLYMIDGWYIAMLVSQIPNLFYFLKILINK